MAEAPDVFVYHNNHVRFIVPTRIGKLGEFCEYVIYRGEDLKRGWLFANHEGDFERAIFTMGDWQDSDRLMNLLVKHGFIIRYDSGDVPMSSGKSESRTAFTKRLLSPGGTQGSAPEFHYSDKEVALVLTGQTNYFLFLNAIMQERRS